MPNPVFKHEDLIKFHFKKFALMAEENISTKLVNLFNNAEYLKKLSDMMQEIREKVMKEAYLKDKYMFNIKFKDSLLIFEYILKKILKSKVKSATPWKGILYFD